MLCRLRLFCEVKSHCYQLVICYAVASVEHTSDECLPYDILSNAVLSVLPCELCDEVRRIEVLLAVLAEEFL